MVKRYEPREKQEHRRHNLTIPQLAEETQTPESYWYEKSRRNEIPGMFRIGRLIRIDLARFYEEVRCAE